MQSSQPSSESSSPADQKGEIDVNPQTAVETVDGWVDSAVALAPTAVVAIIVFILGYVAARLISGFVEKNFKKRDRKDLGLMLGGIIRGAGLIGFGLLALTILVPTLRIGDLIAGLGIGSVAIGFAFKDILQNWLAGFLILLRQPFEIGDQVEINDFDGTVEHIETRSTRLKTYDGRRVIIPNSDVYTNAVLVQTAFEKRRSQYDVGIGYADDIDEATQAILSALESVYGVEADPAPQALPWDLAASWVTIRARWWTDVRRTDVVKTHSDVIRAIKLALDDKAIDMPYDTKVHLIHDQTETLDGHREKQREGWPSDGKDTTPARDSD